MGQVASVLGIAALHPSIMAFAFEEQRSRVTRHCGAVYWLTPVR